jgi:hypothetical protein
MDMSSSNNNDQMESIFSALSSQLEVAGTMVESVRDNTKQAQDALRVATFQLQRLHVIGDMKQWAVSAQATQDALVKAVVPMWATVYARLAESNPENVVSVVASKYRNMFKSLLVNLTEALAYTWWLINGTLITPEGVSGLMELESSKLGLTLDVEEYLTGVAALPKQLTRLAVTCVRNGDYEQVNTISVFMNQVNAGFRLLNLRNDGLRRKFDSIKYDIAKIEDVLYDLAIRKLNTNSNSSSTSSSA